jgi:hypothetical protein
MEGEIKGELGGRRGNVEELIRCPHALSQSETSVRYSAPP